MSGAEILISVDVETAGPIPAEFSMLAIGACVVDAPDNRFECLLKPINDQADSAALEVSGLSLETLARTGLDPQEAMARFERWIDEAAGPDEKPVMVGFNAPFDWSFVNYYFHRFLGRNPFGFTALDIKAYYMGVAGSTWHDTRSSVMRERLGTTMQGDHDALHDALAQAEYFRLARALRGSDQP